MFGAMQVGAVATAAGAGGGALFVPLFSAFLHFSEFSSSHVSALLQMHRCLLSNAIKVFACWLVLLLMLPPGLQLVPTHAA